VTEEKNGEEQIVEMTQAEFDKMISARLARDRAKREEKTAELVADARKDELAGAMKKAEEAKAQAEALDAAEQRLQEAEIERKLTRLFLKEGGRSDSLDAALAALKARQDEYKFAIGEGGELKVQLPYSGRDSLKEPEEFIQALLTSNPGLREPDATPPNQDTLDAQKELSDLLVKGKELREMGRTSTRADLNRMRSLAIKVYGHEGDIPEEESYDEPVQRSESEASKVHSMLLERGLTEEEAEKIEKRGPRAIAKALGY